MICVCQSFECFLPDIIPMKLSVHVIEARGLTVSESSGPRDVYARLSLGKKRARTKVIKKTQCPYWDEKFSFKVGDLNQVLNMSVFAEDKYFNDNALGQVKVPLSTVFDGDSHCIASVWHPLQSKNKKSKNKEIGEICFAVCLSPSSSLSEERSVILQPPFYDPSSSSDKSSELMADLSSCSKGCKESSNETGVEEVELTKEDRSNTSSLVDLFLHIFRGKNIEGAPCFSKDTPLSEDFQAITTEVKPCETEADDAIPDLEFDELLRSMASKNVQGEMLRSLPGGVLIDHCYAVSPENLNSLLFSPDSNFALSMAELQGTTDVKVEAWRHENNGENLKRVLTYIKAATNLIKAVKATEEQTYLKADGTSYAVLASVSVPDVPYGNYFKTEILYCITPGPDLPYEPITSRLVVSWRTMFLRNTIMKGMIENGTRHGLNESYEQFADLLSQNVKLIDLKDTWSNMEQTLGLLQTEMESDWKLLCRFFGNFAFLSSVLVGLYVIVHILLAKCSLLQGLEFTGLDLPDSFEELLVCCVVALQVKHVLNVVRRFLQARKLRGGNHGVKSEGDGWLLKVALIDGCNLMAVDSSILPDPYVVFTCNGQRRTSSIKFHTANPQWNEIFEFDATDDPPSTMDLDVYDFDAPFSEATSLGHAEVNFLKSNLSDLADVWLPLDQKLAQARHSKLHLRIFLNNTRGSEGVTEYLLKMEKEVGKKIHLRSPQTNLAFQKLFGLPAEEFLINDFTCHLKRKMPLQGRLYLSPRIIGYYTNLFGHKTKFSFLWEDIEDIQVMAPTLASIGSPSLMIILRKGRGTEAKHGAKSIDQDGRLKFHFQSFVSFQVANRTIMALWSARSLTHEKKVQIAEKESETTYLEAEDSGSFIGIDDAKMSEVFSTSLPLPADTLMELFGGGDLERKVMEKVGCVDYNMTPWETVKGDVHERQVNYKFDKNLYRYGGEATSTQQKSILRDRNGWIIEEIITLLGVCLGDYFSLHLRCHCEDNPAISNTCDVQISLGIAWLKSTKHQKRITKNVISKYSIRVKEMFRLAERELLPAN